MRRRVVIVGGGIAGLSTAYQLTRDARARARWDVTIYEMGHRWGGRLASAHAPDRWGRNEEHGLHVWFGFYDNVFRLAEEVWRDAPRPAGSPWSTIWDGLRPIYSSDHGLANRAGGIEIRRLHHPRNGARPGAEPLSPIGIVTGLVDLARALAASLVSMVGDREVRPAASTGPLFPAPDTDALVHRVDRALVHVANLARAFAIPGSRVARRELGRVVEGIVRATHPHVVALGARLCGAHTGLRAALHALDVTLATLRAITSPEHGILEDGDLDRVSAFELRELLARHGAHDDTLRSNFLDALYDMPFAYRDGDRARPIMEASTALRYTLRLVLGYKHAIAYLLAAGAGETLVAPLYALLRRRGVHFRPFHRLAAMRLDHASARVARLEMVRAARVRATYDPLIERGGLIGFRADPVWEALEDGEALRARGVDFYSRFADRGETTRVELNAGRDFDDVVLALPLGCIVPDGDGHSPVAEWLAATPAARRCVEHLHVVPTVAAQLWFREAPATCGVDGRTVVTWRPPYSVACDMSPVIAHEAWPAPGPGACAYLCGPWPLDAHRAPSSDRAARVRADDIARASLVAQVADVGDTLWRPGTALYAPPGTDAWAAQYVRANVEPWDLADLPLPGADAVRLEATGSGLGNLALAGSWVRTPVNTTSVEAAVASGIAAARALGAASQPILGEALLRRPPARVVLPGRERGVAEPAAARDWPATEWLA